MGSREPRASSADGFARLRQPVLDEWIDYNGHLSEAYYVLAFGFATDAVMDHLGLDADYRARTGCSLYTVEAHIRYLREVESGCQLVITTVLVGSWPKKLRLCHEMSVSNTLVATEELLTVHVDSEHGRSTPMPDHALHRLGEFGRHVPDYAGRAIG